MMIKKRYIVCEHRWNYTIEEYTVYKSDFGENFNQALEYYKIQPLCFNTPQIELWQDDGENNTLLRKAEYDPEEYEGRYELKPEEW